MTQKKPTSRTKTGTLGRDVKSARSEILAREAKVLELRALGWNMDRIATETGYCDSSGVAKALRRALLRQAALSVEELKRMESHKLDELEGLLHELLRMPGVAVDSAVRVIGEIRKILERRSRLHGLDAGSSAGRGETTGRGNDWAAERGYDLIVIGDGVDPALIPWDALRLNPSPGAGTLPPPVPSVILEPAVAGPGPTRHIIMSGGFLLGGIRYSLPEEAVSAELLAALAGDG